MRGAMPSANPVAIFAALGDPTRAELVHRLGAGDPQSIARLGRDIAISRQALTKHLRNLEGAGLATQERVGRETLYRIDPAGLLVAQRWIGEISAQWDDVIDRLKRHVEG